MARAWLLVGWIAFMGGCSSDDDGGGTGGTGNVSPSCASPTTDVEKNECDILALVNQQRLQGATCGGQQMPAAPPLEMHPVLRQVARGHAEDMAQNDYFRHDSLDGRSPFDRMKAAGYDFSQAGENIVAGSPTAAAAMQEWMGSPGHCQNIMEGGYVHIGVGYAYSDGHQYGHLWVQDFGSP